MTKKIKYNDRRRVQIKFNKRTPTKQSFKDECDINNIMATYAKTGSTSHLNRKQPQYGYASGHDFAQSMRIVTQANADFAALPSEVRSRFANDPGQFLNFVQDPDNLEEMADLGLLNEEASQRLSDATTAAEQQLPPAKPPQAPPLDEHPATE